MTDIERSWLINPARRAAIARMAGLLAASPVAAAMAEIDPRPLSEHRRVMTLGEVQTAFDFEPIFHGNVLLPIYDYTAHGEGSEFTLRRNRQAFDWVDILPGRAPVPAERRPKTIRIAFTDCPFGRMLVGATDKGVCFLGFAEPDEALLGDLRRRIARRTIAGAGVWIMVTVTSAVTPQLSRRSCGASPCRSQSRGDAGGGPVLADQSLANIHSNPPPPFHPVRI